MYGNGMQGPFMMPNMGYGNMLRAVPPMAPSMPVRTGGGLRALLGLAPGGAARGGIFSGLRSFNWSGLLNNASKALGVVNQAIPVVKQVGPMMNNMKSMLKIASVFKDETDTRKSAPSNNTSAPKQEENKTKETTDNSQDNNQSIIKTNNNEPNFFL